VTYKPEVSGQLEISISCDGIAISGSPFTADAVTLTSQPLHSPFTAPSQPPHGRAVTLKAHPLSQHACAHHGALASPQVMLKAEPSRCLLRGDALKHAVARQPMSFDIEFVDNLGQVRAIDCH
jgi:hypothetical protein